MGSKPLATVSALSLCLGGCVHLPSPRPQVLELGKMNDRTSFELRGTGGLKQDEIKRPRVTPALFWTGIALASLGVVGMAGFGGWGLDRERKIKEGYDEGMTFAEKQKLQDQGENANTGTLLSAGVVFLGAALATIAWGIDYNRCGPLAPKRRRCRDR